jgi:hypothetical protein
MICGLALMVMIHTISSLGIREFWENHEGYGPRAIAALFPCGVSIIFLLS